MRGGGAENEKERRSGVISVQGEGVPATAFVLFSLCFPGNATEVVFNRCYSEFLILTFHHYRCWS